MASTLKSEMRAIKATVQPTRSSTRMRVVTQAYIIRLCRECVHYSEQDDTCKVLSIINHAAMDVTKIKSLYCRTREDLCGMNAKYYEPKQETPSLIPPLQPTVLETSKNIVIEADHTPSNLKITYYIDGSVNICGDGCNIDNYYDNLHQDFNDIY